MQTSHLSKHIVSTLLENSLTLETDIEAQSLHPLEVAKEAVWCGSNTGAGVAEICIRTLAPSTGFVPSCLSHLTSLHLRFLCLQI